MLPLRVLTRSVDCLSRNRLIETLTVRDDRSMGMAGVTEAGGRLKVLETTAIAIRMEEVLLLERVSYVDLIERWKAIARRDDPEAGLAFL